MADGLLLGALLLLLGMGMGGSVVWLIERWHDGERAQYLRHIGYLQDQLEQGRAQSSIPDEEL